MGYVTSMDASAGHTSREATFNQNQNLELKINFKIIKVIFCSCLTCLGLFICNSLPQQTITCSKSTIITLEKGVNFVQSCEL